MLIPAALLLAAVAAPQSTPADAYTITTTLRLAQPYRLSDMNDEFQSAQLIQEKDGVGTFKITYRPFHVQTVTADPLWRQHDKGMVEYLKPRPAANWDDALRQTILKDLKQKGVDPTKLDDKTLVQKVSKWALDRSSFNDQFGLWMVHFDSGKAVVKQGLEKGFWDNEPKGIAFDKALNQELFGKGMYENKTHGACTSTATYITTILRSLGIPTRIILTVPAFDSNDPDQTQMLVKAIRRQKTALVIRCASVGSGFENHVYNEVWVGGKWVRLNYDRLGQPILDKDYCGLMTHIYTTTDFSEVPYADSWGTRYATGAGPKLSSINPYQLIAASDDLAPGATMDNPPVPELTAATITAIYQRGSPKLPSWVSVSPKTDAILMIEEWLPDRNYIQQHDFLHGAGHNFSLVALGHPTLSAKLSGENVSDGSGHFQGYGVHVEGKLYPGVDYTLVPENEGHANSWKVAPGLTWRG